MHNDCSFSMKCHLGFEHRNRLAADWLLGFAFALRHKKKNIISQLPSTALLGSTLILGTTLTFLGTPMIPGTP